MQMKDKAKDTKYYKGAKGSCDGDMVISSLF